MFNWFSSLELNGVESVACSLLVSAVLGSAIIFLCIIMGSFIRSLQKRYWLIFLGQLSTLVIFIGCMVMFYHRGAMSDTEGEILLNEVSVANVDPMIPVAENEAPHSEELSNKLSDFEHNGDIVDLDQVESKEPSKDVVLELTSTETTDIEKAFIDQTMTMTVTTILKNSNMIVWAWGLGVTLLFIRWVLGAYGLLQLKRSGVVAPSDLTSVFSKLEKRYLKRKIRLRQSASIVSPMVVGWIKPIVYVPCGLMTRMAPDQVEAIILHELAHICRNDYFWNLIQRLSEVMFFFNPVIWWSGKMVRQLREEICDEFVVAETCKPKRYAEALYSLEESRGEWLAVRATDSNLKRRFEALLGRQKTGFNPLSSFAELAIVLVLGLACFAPVALNAQPEEEITEVPDRMVCDPIYGRVIDLDGNAVSGAKVMLYYGKDRAFDPRSKIVEELVSVEDGSYRFKSERVYSDQGGNSEWSDHYAVIVKHPDWAIGWQTIASPRILAKKAPVSEEVVVTMEPAVSQSFDVRMMGDEDKQSPLEGAKVNLAFLHCHEYDVYGRNLYLWDDLGLSSGVTDKNGKVTLNGLPARKCSFLITHKAAGRSWKTRAYNQKDDWFTRCYPAAGVNGRVVKPNGDALANTLLEISSNSGRWGWDKWYVETDIEGRYFIDSLYGEGDSAGLRKDKAEFTISVISDDWFAGESFKLLSKEFKNLPDLVVARGTPIKVYTKNLETGEAIPYAKVFCGNDGGIQYKYSDAEGVAKFDVLPGTCHFSMGSSEGVNVNVVKDLKKQTVELTATTRPEKVVEGVVVIPSNEKNFKGRIRLRSVETSSRYFAKLGKVEGNKRHFQISVPADQTYSVHAQDLESSLMGIGTLKSQSDELVIELEPEKSQQITLRNADGELLKNQKLFYGEYDSKYVRDLTHIDILKTNDRGEVTLNHLRKEAEYYIHLPNDDYNRAIFQLGPNKNLDVKISHWLDVNIEDDQGKVANIEKIVDVKLKSASGVIIMRGLDFEKNHAGSWRLHKKRFVSDMIEDDVFFSVVAKLENDDLVNIEASAIKGKGYIRLQTISSTLLTEQRVRSIANNTPQKKIGEKAKGLIVDETGTPIKGARLVTQQFVNILETNDASIKPDRNNVAITDEKGEFSILLKRNSQSPVRIDAEGFASRWISTETLSEGLKEITLQKRSICEGVIKDKKGNPMSNETLYFITERKFFSLNYLRLNKFRYNNGVFKLKFLRVMVQTDNQGRFSQVLEPGKWQLQGVVEEDLIIDEKFELKLGQKLTLSPQLKPSVNLMVRVKDKSTEEPVKGALIKLRKNLDYDDEVSAQPEIEDGKLFFKGLTPGRYDLVYMQGITSKDIAENKYFSASPSRKQKYYGWSQDKGPFMEVVLKSGHKEVDVSLTSGTLVKAKISSKLISNFEEVRVDVITGDRGRIKSVGGYYCSKNGEFSGYFPLKKGTPYRLIAYEEVSSAENKVATSVSDHFIMEDNKIPEMSLELKQGASLKGRFVDKEGKPMSNRTVIIHEMTSSPSTTKLVTTDKNGYFIFNGVQPGSVSLTVGHPSRMPIEVNELKEGEETDLGDRPW